MEKQIELNDWANDYPAEVIEAADKFDKAHTEHQKTKGKLNTAKQTLIDAMEEHECERVQIRNGEKYLQHEERDVIKFDKPKAASDATTE